MYIPKPLFSLLHVCNIVYSNDVKERVMFANGYTKRLFSFLDVINQGLLDVIAVGASESGWWISGGPTRYTVSYLQSGNSRETMELYAKSGGAATV